MTATASSVVPSGRTRSPSGGRSLGLVVDLPDRLLVAGVAVCVVVSVALVAQAFRPVVVLPLAAVAALLAQRARPAALRPSAVEAVAVVVVLVGVLAWVLANLPYRAEDVVVTRDPGNYTLTALWLVDHPSPRIPVGPGAGSPQGFDEVDGAWHPHGLHLLPALAAVIGWAAGRDGVLAGGLVVGAVALLAVFALARRLCGGVWALLPVTALALSLPFLHVSRSMYTEPLALALACAGGVGLLSAVRGGGAPAWVLSGSGLGAVALTRIDGTLPLLGATASVGLLALLGDDSERRRLGAGLRLQTAAALPLVALGLADGWVGSRPYLLDHGGRVLALTALLGLTSAVTVVLVAWPPQPVRSAVRGLLGPRGGPFVAGLLGLAVLVLLSRPWWYVSRAAAVSHPHREALQRAAGVPVDGTRTYDELSLTWLSWYWGWPAVLLGLAGLVVMTGVGLRRREWGLVVLAGLVVPSLLLYSVRVSIFPDQVWAVRRFLPVVLPGVLVAGAWSLSRAWRVRPLRLPVLALAVLVAAWPAVTLPGLWATVEWEGRLAGAQRLCDTVDTLPPGPVLATGPVALAPTLRVVCARDVVAVEEPTRAALATAVQRAGGEALPLVTAAPAGIAWDGPVPAPLVDLGATRWEQTLLHPPERVERVELAVTVATVAADGTVSG